MAKQNQPSAGGPSTPSQSGGRTGTNDYNFTEDDVITGSVLKPDDTFQSIQDNRSPIPFPIAEAAGLQDAQSGGTTGKAVVKLIEWLLKRVAEYLKGPGKHKYHFDINYHNHDIPIPIPLTPFITNLSLSETINAPYVSGNIELKIPFEHIQTIFKSAGGRIDSGGFISINQKSFPSLTNKIEDERIRDNHFLTQLLVVNNINYGVSATADGIIDCTLNLDCTSFLHPLIMGQYKVSETKRRNYSYTDPEIKDEKVEAAGVKVQTESEQALWEALGIPDTDPIRKVSSRPVVTSVKSADGKEVINEFWFEGQLYNRFLTLMMEGSVIRKDSGADLKNMLSFLAYPKTPSSLTFNLGIEKWYQLAQRELDKGAVFYVRLLRTQGVPEEQIQTLGKELLRVFDTTVVNQPGVGSRGIFANRRFISDEPPEVRSNGYQTLFKVEERPGDTTVAAELLKEELAKGAGSKLDFSFGKGEEFRLGDVIRVFSVNSTDDLPNNRNDVFPWVTGLGTSKEIIENLNKVSNLYAKGQTIWGACVSTFQPDSKTHELFPVVIPLMDKKWFERANDFERAIGGILGVVYRKKPIHPYISLNKNSINKEYSVYRRVFTSKTDDPYYKDINYKLNAEELEVQQETFVDLDNTFQLTGNEEYATEKTPLPVLNIKDILTMNFSHSDTMRVNGIQVEHPYSQVDPNTSGNLLTEPYVNALDASRFGFRFYQSNYPFLQVNSPEKGKFNLGNVMAENLYMTIGDGSKYSTGSILLPLETTFTLKQGCWFIVNFTPPTYEVKEGFDYGGNSSDDRVNKFIAYCTNISYTYTVDQSNGNILTRTQVNFERGSYGGLIPELPDTKHITYVDGKVSSTEITGTLEKTSLAEIPRVRYLADEYGFYGDAATQEKRNEVFETIYAGASSVIEGTTRANEGNEPGSFYYDIDGDGKYEWYKDASGNAYLILPKDRPGVTDFIFADFNELVRDGYTTPIKVDAGKTAPEPVAEDRDDYNFTDEEAGITQP